MFFRLYLTLEPLQGFKCTLKQIFLARNTMKNTTFLIHIQEMDCPVEKAEIEKYFAKNPDFEPVATDLMHSTMRFVAKSEKATSKLLLENLKKAGITRTVMLTGDGKKVAESVAADLGIGEVHSELLPADKVSKVEELLSNKSEKEKLAFVGDGINDAPVLSRADIGIAMGALGSDAAIEAADVVLMDDDPLKIGKAIRIAKKCMRIVYENIYFAIGVKLICLVLGAFGIANMWIAIFADVGVMVLAVLNAIRTLFVKNL